MYILYIDNYSIINTLKIIKKHLLMCPQTRGRLGHSHLHGLEFWHMFWMPEKSSAKRIPELGSIVSAVYLLIYT